MKTNGFQKLATITALGTILALGACDAPEGPSQADKVPPVQTNESEEFLYRNAPLDDDGLEGRMEDGALGGTPSDRPEETRIPDSQQDADQLPNTREDDPLGTMGGGTIEEGVEEQETRIPEGTAHDPVTDGSADTFLY